MGILPRRERRRHPLFNRKLHFAARLEDALRNSPGDFDRTYEPNAAHHRRRLIYGFVNFVVARLGNVSRGDRRRVDDADQQKQNECPKTAPHLAPLLEVKIAKLRGIVNVNMRMSCGSENGVSSLWHESGGSTNGSILSPQPTRLAVAPHRSAKAPFCPSASLLLSFVNGAVALSPCGSFSKRIDKR